MPRSSRRAVESLRVDAVQKLHPLGQVGRRCLNEKVIVIRHQAVRVTDPPEPGNDLTENVEELQTIIVSQVDVFASIPAAGETATSCRATRKLLGFAE